MKQFRDTPYYVTEDGKVFRHYPDRYVKNGKVPKTGEQKYLFKSEMWVKVGALDKDGYQIVDISIHGKKQGFKSHRMVAELYCDGYFEGAHVDHIDCNKLNNHPNNLQWCTKEYNSKKGDNPNYPLFAQY